MPGSVEVMRPAAPGDGMVRADEDAARRRRARARRAPAASAGPRDARRRRRDRDRRARAPARGDRLDRRRGRARRRTARLARRARSATRPRRRWPRWCARPAASRVPRGIVPDDRDALDARAARRAARAATSSWSRPGRRSARATRPPRRSRALGEPGIWCHGLALRPGKPTLLADCGGVPVIGLPGNPRSALVVFRLVGMPIVRQVGGMHRRRRRSRPSGRGWRVTCRRAAGRLDVVQVTRRATASRCRCSAPRRCCRCSRPPTAASSCPRPATGLAAGSRGRGHAVPE